MDIMAGCITPIGIMESLYPRFVLIKGSSSISLYDIETGKVDEIVVASKYEYWGQLGSLHCSLWSDDDTGVKRVCIATIEERESQSSKGSVSIYSAEARAINYSDF